MYINKVPHTWNIPSVGWSVGVGRNSSGLDLFWPMQSKILTSFLFVAWALGSDIKQTDCWIQAGFRSDLDRLHSLYPLWVNVTGNESWSWFVTFVHFCCFFIFPSPLHLSAENKKIQNWHRENRPLGKCVKFNVKLHYLFFHTSGTL